MFLEMIKSNENDQNYANNFQKCPKLLNYYSQIFARNYGKVPAKPMSIYDSLWSAMTFMELNLSNWLIFTSKQTVDFAMQFLS